MSSGNKTKKWKWILGAVALTAAAGAEGWALKKQSDRVCRSAVDLAQHAGSLRVWLAEADADPFLGAPALRGPVNAVIAEFRARSRWIQSELGARLLPEQARAAFQELNTTGDNNTAFFGALAKVAELKAGLKCEGRIPAGEESSLARQVDAANEFWRDQKAHAELAKIEFERDRVIFCKGDELMHGLQRVVQASIGRCQGAKLSAKLAAACEAQKNGPVAAEITDLEKQKEFNMRKLRQKWPEPVLKGLQCS